MSFFELNKIAYGIEDARRATSGLKNLIRRNLSQGTNGKLALSNIKSIKESNISSMKNHGDNILKKLQGKVFQGPGGLIASLDKEYPEIKNLSSRQKEMLNRVGIIHEKFELSPHHNERLNFGFHSHNSPGVILRESSLLRSMNKEFDPVKKIIGSSRHKERIGFPGIYGKSNINPLEFNKISRKYEADNSLGISMLNMVKHKEVKRLDKRIDG